MKAAIVYSFSTSRTSRMADLISAQLSELAPERLNVEELNPELLSEFDFIVAGVPTWFDGEMPYYWDEWMPALEEMGFHDKTFAVFGLADQKGYPDHFADAVGIFARFMSDRGARIIGKTSTHDYEFRKSKALEGDKFIGLILDEDNQPEKSVARIEQWCRELLLQLESGNQ